MPVKPSKVSTSLVVDFGQDGDSNGILKAEVDDLPTGLNGGDTSFIPGQTVGYMVAKSSNVSIEAHIATYNAPVFVGTRTFTHTELLTFTGEEEVSPEYPILGAFTYAWLGRNPGTLNASETSITLTKSPGIVDAVGVAKISYTTTVDLYTLDSPVTLGGVNEFSIVIYLRGVSA